MGEVEMVGLRMISERICFTYYFEKCYFQSGDSRGFFCFVCLFVPLQQLGNHTSVFFSFFFKYLILLKCIKMLMCFPYTFENYFLIKRSPVKKKILFKKSGREAALPLWNRLCILRAWDLCKLENCCKDWVCLSTESGSQDKLNK